MGPRREGGRRRFQMSEESELVLRNLVFSVASSRASPGGSPGWEFGGADGNPRRRGGPQCAQDRRVAGPICMRRVCHADSSALLGSAYVRCREQRLCARTLRQVCCDGSATLKGSPLTCSKPGALPADSRMIASRLLSASIAPVPPRTALQTSAAARWRRSGTLRPSSTAGVYRECAPSVWPSFVPAVCPQCVPRVSTPSVCPECAPRVCPECAPTMCAQAAPSARPECCLQVCVPHIHARCRPLEHTQGTPRPLNKDATRTARCARQESRWPRMSGEDSHRSVSGIWSVRNIGGGAPIDHPRCQDTASPPTAALLACGAMCAVATSEPLAAYACASNM